jgi:DNA-binding NtrC family response regulator
VLLEGACERAGKDRLGLTQAARRWLLARPWPGNVRELANTIQRAVALSDTELLTVEDFDPSSAAPTATIADQIMEASMTLEQLERVYLKRVLQRTRGNKTLAAQILGLERRTVYRKVAELGLEEDQ